ncbi:MAG: DUF4097 family beta strand repeat protein [Verrucomicrobia bacterium]|nr:DUF4097 family beta strand repeat protein [Verrucomicrobiota bacterium]
MKSLFLLAAALLTATAAYADSYSFKEPFSRTAPFSATGELSLDNVNGSVEIRTWDKNEILIEGEKSAKTDEELKLIELTIDTAAPAAATIKVHLPKRPGAWFSGSNIRAAVTFKITVPATANLAHIRTVNSALTLDGLAGPVNAATVNGRITVTALRGNATLETVNGSLNASFAALTAGQRLFLDTTNGSITVTLPANAGAAIDASVVNGYVDCDFPLTLSGGRIHGSSLKGAIGDARAALRARTVNGSIHLVKKS